MARLCRRVCLLRHQGDLAAAERLRSTELAETAAAARTSAGLDETEADRKLAAIFAMEQERVANAALLAELLAPLLQASPVALTAAPVRQSPEPVEAESIAEGARAPRPAGGNIADFIDEMLAQDRAARSGPRGRRAS